MGKYMKKPKPTNDNYTVAVTPLSPASLGVRTRAKTLALLKLNSTTETPAEQQRRELSYLQLRSRRLEKPQLTCCRNQNPNSRVVGNCSDGIILVGSGLIETSRVEEFEECCYVGENNIDFDSRERSTRESTPCSLIKDKNVITTPGSSTRSIRINQNFVTRSMPLAQEIEEFFARHEQEQQRRFTDRSTRESTPCSSIKDKNVITTPGSSTRSIRINQNFVTRSMPLAQEIEEFFARHEQEQQRRFTDRYNFDIVNENPLEGCYEWVRVESL